MGVRYFDTAPMYGDGRSEVRYGRVLGEFPRESFAISTKGSRVLRPEKPGRFGTLQRGWDSALHLRF